MNENPNNPDYQDTVYLTRRSKKERRTRIVIYIILTLFVGGIAAYISLPIREHMRIKNLNRLAALPFPELSDDYQSHLVLEENWSGRISTEWITTNTYLDEHNMFAGYIRVQAADFLFDPQRKYPPISVVLYISAQHPAHLPLNDLENTPLTFVAHETFIIPNDSDGLSQKNIAPQDNCQTMLFYIPIETFIAAINHGSITLKLADHTINFTDEQFQALKDFAATLKPGFEPPIPAP